ncbi:MAG: two-component system, sensor histidine kinase and response regulator [Verrucomicrobiota bacterium]|jgi:PAS domain S-box-containing protein
MSKLNGALTSGAGSLARADALFKQHQQEIYRNTDKLFARLMLVQWVAGIIGAFLIAPRTWNGQSSAIHVHVWAAIFLGGAISVFPIWMTRAWPGAAVTRYVIAVAQMLMSALLIGLSGGRIETHFHVFGSLVILSFYRDWRVLIPATIVVALDHFLRGVYWPYSVYGVLTASPWRSIEHAAWVVFEDVFLVISCLRSVREMRSIANRTAALEASEQNFRQIFEEAPIGMGVVGLDEKFEQVNATFCRMVGYSEEELQTRTPIDITYSEDVESSKQLAKAMLEGDAHHSVEKRYVRKTGEVLWATRTACVIRDVAGKPRHFLIMVEDISDRKRNEKALRETKEEADRANRAKSEFLSRMSHELRTPLNAIIGFGQLLDRQNPTEVQRTRLQYILGAGRHLLDLINEVLDISRIEIGKIQLSLEPVAVGDALAEALDLLRPLAAERSIEISIATKIDSDAFVLADRQRLKQVLLNLLTNAVKYTQIGGSVTVSTDSTDGNQRRIVVSDTGAGIPQDKLARLFTPFDRLGAEQSDVQGTGLGLALCQRLMQAMGGTIGVQSTVGRGSTFWAELPSVESPLKRVAARRKPAPLKSKEVVPTKKRKILYVEDNFSNLTLVEQILQERTEFELIAAMQGKIGVDLARQHVPDLILLDLHLPDMPGWDVLTQLKAAEKTRHIPTVIISADATARQIKRLMAAGAHAYLTKPIDVAQFYRVLDQATPATSDAANCVPAL